MCGLIELLTLTTVQSSSGWLTSKIKSSEDELRTLINVRAHWMFALRNCPGCEPQSSFIVAVINFKLLSCVHCLIRALHRFLKSLSDAITVVFDAEEGKLSQFIRKPQPVHNHTCVRRVAETCVQVTSKCTNQKRLTDFLSLPHVFLWKQEYPGMLQRPQTKDWHTFGASEKTLSHHTRRGQ